MLRSTHSTEDAHFSPPRQLERYPEQAHHSSVPGPPRHRSSMSTDLSHNPQPSRQSRPQPVYMHELSSEFPHRPPPSLQAESDSHRHDNPSMEFSTHQTSSHESDQSPQIRHSADHPATDRARYAQSPPQSFKVQHATYSGRDHLASPIVMQSHPSYSGPSPRQPLPTHYEHQHHPATQNESPFNQNLNSSVIRAEHPPEGRPTVGSLHGVSFAHQASRSQAPSNGFPSSHEHCLVSSQEAHQQKRRSVPSNNPRRNSRPTKVEKVDELPRAGTSQLWSRDAADTSHMDHVYAKVSNVSLSNKPECNREKTAKSSSQPELPISKGLTNIPPAPDLRLASQGGLSTDVKRPKLSHQNSRPSSPSKYSLPVHHKEKDTDNIISPAPSRPKAAHETTNADCDTSREPSSTDDAAVDDGVIRCICSITTDDGFTIQCETCEVWQHAVCVNVPIDEVPEHYFCDRCDPSPERRRRLVEMAPQAERIQRQRLQKEADARSQDQDENSIAPDSPCPSNHPGLDERDESLVGSPAASTAMSRVSSGARPNDSIHGEPPGQSPHSYVKGKNKASSSGHQERVQTIPYPDNGLGLSGLQESPTTISAARIDDLSLPRDAAPRKPGRKPTKFAQPKSQSSKQSLDPPLSCSVANNVMETDSNVLAQNGADNDDRYEAWRYEYTPTLKDLYLDAEVKCQVQQLIKHYTRLRTVCDNDAAIGSDTETPGQEVDKSVAPASSKSIPPPSMESCRSPAPVVDQLAQVSDIPVKPQRPIPHAFASTNFLPVTMSELPPPSKLTIKAIPPSAINFFPSLATNPFCPNFATSLNNSSTSSLPRLITHGVFSTQPIPRGSFIASIKGSITSVRKYTEDVYNQYASLGCNKPYVKFFKSTRLEDPFLRDQDLAQIDDGLVIDSRQYGNEMRFVRNGCHPNAFINIIMTPPAPRLHDSELPNKPDISQSRTPSTLTSSFPTPSLDRPNHPNNLWSTADCDRPSHWEVSFGIFAASDISRREEIILPWEWDDQHLVHLLPRLLSHSTAFEAQQQRSPTLPPARIRFLPWSMSDLRLLSCKLAAVTLTFFGLMVCGCERKRSCAINLMWKIGCLSAGQPMFPTEDGTADSEVCEMTSISNLKERQEMNLPLTFEEKLRIALNSFLEQPYHLPSKIGRSANPNVNTPSVGRPKKPKIDLGPLLGLKRDWWRYPAAYRSEAESSRTLKTMTKKQKRPRSRSVFNRKPSVHKIRRVSDVGELRQPGLTVANSINHTKASSPQAHPRRASSIHQSNSTQTALSGMHTDNQSAVPSLSIPLNQHHISPPPPPSSQHAPLTNGANSFTLRPDAKQDTAPLLPMSFNTTLLPESTPVTSGSHSIEAVAPQVNGDSQSEPLMVDGKDVVDPITCISEAQEVTKEGNDQIQPGSNQPEHAMEVVSEDIMSEEASFPVSQPHAQNDAAPAFPSAGTFEESSNPSSAPEEGELQEDETCSEEMIEQPSAQVLPTGPTPGYRFPVEVKKLESNFVKTPDGEPSENEQTVPGDDGDAVPVNQLSAQFGSSAESIDRERPRRASPGGPPEPSPPKSSLVGPDEGKVIEDSYAQDSPTSGTQQPYTDVPIGRPPVRSQDEENNYSLDDPTSHVSLPSNSKIASSHVQDSSQSVASIGELAPQPVVGSPKGLDAQKPPAVALSHNDELEPVIQASSKSPEPMHDAPFVDTHETLSIKKDVDDHRETFIIEPQSTDQRSVTNVANGTDPHISTLECQHLNFPASEETRHSPKSTASPSLNPGIAENPRTESPTRLSRRSMSTTNSEAHSEAQDESALSQASEGSEEHLLDSDASTTILGSSDEEMLSSHTPRYLNNRKRIRSKNIIKPPPRMAAVKKGGSLRAERPSGLPAGAMPRFSKPELRAVDKLKSLPAGYQKGDSTRTSSLSDLESEDQARGNSADPMVKKPPGSQMRLTIRSSSPSEIDDIESSEPVVDKQQVQDKLAAVNLPSAVAESQVPGDFQPTAQEQSLVTEKSKATQSSDASAGTGLDPPKNSSLESPAEVSATHSAKAAPKRISLKDYRSRKFSETVVITPLANPLIHFTTSRPPTSTTVTEESHKKQPPPPIIPVLPPLLPPTSQSQPLLPLSPRKLELVASVLKKEEKDRAPLSHEGETDSKKPKHEDQIPTMLPGSSSLSIEASHQLPQGREAPADELDLKLSPNPTALGSSGKIPSTNIVQHESEPRHANPCPQSCEDAALDSYEDDIDGVAIESMSTQSEGEPDDEVRQQELIGKEQQLERHTLEEPKDNVQIHESVQMLAEAQPAASGENHEQSEEPTEEQVPVATAQDQQDKEIGVASGEAQRQQQEQVGVELPQDSGLDKSKKSNASDEAEPPFVDGADRASTQAAIMTVANEGPDQMEDVDEAERCPQTNTVAVEDRLPTRSDQLPSSRPERADSPAVTTIPSVPREEDAGISSTIVQQAAPAPAPKPRLSLADYRRRNVRPSVSEERHPSQSMSPSLPDLELSRANPPLSSVCSQSLRQNPIANSQPSQQEPKKTHEDAPIPPAAANQARHPLPSSPRPITSPSQQPEHKTKLEDVEPPEVSATLNISSESRSTDATMYFPPISPSILMGMESPRSPELKSPPLPPGSPSEETSLGRETNVAASCSPWQKSPSRTPLESTPVTSTSSLKGDLKPPIVANQPTHPRVASDLAKLSGTEDPFLGQTAPPAVDSRSVLPLPVVQPPSPPKCEASCASSAQTSNLPPHNTLDHPKTSPSVLVPSLPVPITSHSHVHQHLKPASVAVSGPTPIEVVNPLNCRVQQSPSKTKFPGAHGDQPIPSAPSSRLITAPSTSQRSPTIPLSPLAYKPRTSVSPSSPAPTGLPEIKSSPRGRSNLPPALNRAPSTSRTLRAPPNHNNTTRASWPPESAAGPCQTEPQHTNQGPPVAMPFSDMPINPSLPPPPTHAAGSSRTSTYHHYSSSHRGGRFPPMRNFSGHRATTTTPITGTSGPGPPGSFRQSQSVNNEGVERARYDGILRGPVPHHASHYPARGRAKVRGGAHPSSSYWSSDNNAGSGGHGGNSSSSGRGLGGPPRNDR